jgi:hypothetical protein
MRLWSISPIYLDTQGLCGLWRETLLGQACLLKGEYQDCPDCSLDKKYNGRLTPEIGDMAFRAKVNCLKCKGTGKIKTPYWGHPQLQRFKANKDLSLYWITAYLYAILDEGLKRGYKFDKTKIRLARQVCCCMWVTRGQLAYEFEHLYKKLLKRDKRKAEELKKIYFSGDSKLIEAHPLFKVIESPEVESWEK